MLLAETKLFSNNFQQCSQKYWSQNGQRHYVFYIVEGVDKPTIIGVIHEVRDIVVLLASRLTGDDKL